ncbi:hypothetical protein H1P_5300002 [Hyella patelloides LEGE 07179]|uniref:Uncharacterized protein n=1 Tax=Hyella patelloides LEGE 07179 TaxID=945734 RepID=A0A563W062_9CYAN|nr:hypothetical protein H1P_5300002 [Hyella patelloides LEGE 07179]
MLFTLDLKNTLLLLNQPLIDGSGSTTTPAIITIVSDCKISTYFLKKSS